MRSGGEHCPPELQVEEDNEKRGQARRREENSESANINSNNPHLTGGEKHTQIVVSIPVPKALRYPR